MRLSFLATFYLLFTITLHAQKADSIRTLIRQTPSDTSRVLLYSALANELTKSDPPQSIIAARAGLALSLKIDFPKGVFKNYFSLASSFQGQAMFDSAIYYYHCSKNVALFRDDLHGEAEVYSGLGHSFMRKFMMDSARHYLDEGLAIAKQIANFRIEAGIYNNYGNVYLEETNYPKALDYFIAAARLYKDPLNDDYGQCLALSNIGNIEYRLGNYDRALRYAEQSMAIAKRKNLTSSIGYAHKLFGRIYRKQKKYQDALTQYQAAQKLYTTVGDTRSASELLLNIGNIYFDQEKYSDALRNYLQSIPLAKQIDNKTLIANGYACIGEGYMALKKIDQAIIYYDSGLEAATKLNNRYLMMDFYASKSQAYELKGDFKQALNFHKLFVQQKDSVTKYENRAVVEETQAKFDLERKETQISLLEKDKALQLMELNRHRALQIGAVIVIILVIIIALLLLNRYRVRHEVERLTEIESMRNAIARDLHDDIGSTLSTINIISKLAMRENGSKNESHLLKIAEQSSQMMESMTDMVWSINPVNDTLEKVIVKMKVFTSEILEPKNIDYQFEVIGKIELVVLDAEKRKNLFLIFKEALNNIAKYSGAQLVKIQISLLDDHLILLVSDNGKGFDEKLIKHGNGLANMRTRSTALQGSFELKSETTGTSITLKIPLHH